MNFYYVKQDLFGVPRGRVERFAAIVAPGLLASGAIEAFDEKKHGRAPGADDVPADQRRPPAKCQACGK